VKKIHDNKKAFFDYEILEKFEAGIVLLGCEIKSIREARVNLKGAYVLLKGNEAWLRDMHIARYKFHTELLDEKRDRKLLLNKREMLKIEKKLNEQGISCVPLSVYLKNGLCKIQIAIARGKKQYDKRESLKKKSLDRDLSRKLKNY
jgi:SsrA-binding protein